MSPQAETVQASTTDMQEKLKTRILTVIDQVDTGFQRVMHMYLISFYFGLVLIIFSLVGTLYSEPGENRFLLLFGGAGLVDVVAFFIFKPIEDLQRSRANLAQLVAAFLTWYNDTHNWNLVFEEKIKRRELGVDMYKEISKMNILNTATIMCVIELFVASKIKFGESGKLKAAMEEIKGIVEGG